MHLYINSNNLCTFKDIIYTHVHMYVHPQAYTGLAKIFFSDFSITSYRRPKQNFWPIQYKYADKNQLILRFPFSKNLNSLRELNFRLKPIISRKFIKRALTGYKLKQSIKSCLNCVCMLSHFSRV